MRKTYSLMTLSLFICFLISCDGRERPFIPNTEVLKENKLLDSFSENSTYVPAKKVEIVTDTILSNGVNVKIKNRTDTSDNISSSYTKKNIKYITNYLQFIADIEIKKDEKSIFSTTINKAVLIDKYNAVIKENVNLKNIRFGGAFIDQEKSISDAITLSFYLDDPIIEILYIYSLVITKNGDKTIEFSEKLRYG